MNYSIVNSMVSMISEVSLWYRPYYKDILSRENDNKCRKLMTIKNRFSLILERRLAFDSISNLVREVKNLSPDFKGIA